MPYFTQVFGKVTVEGGSGCWCGNAMACWLQRTWEPV